MAMVKQIYINGKICKSFKIRGGPQPLKGWDPLCIASATFKRSLVPIKMTISKQSQDC